MTAPLHDDASTLLTRGLDAGTSGRALRVMVSGDVLTFALPSAGVAVLGRGADVDFRVDETSISRRHARLHLGDGIEIEDLGSANGTRVGGRLLAANERVAVHPGDALEFGRCLAALQGPRDRDAPRRLWSHDHFERVLDDACARGGRALAVLRVSVGPAAPAGFDGALLAALREGDLAASYGPGEYEVLLDDATPDAVERAATSLVDAVTRAGALRTGLAVHPRDGRTGPRLLGRACAAVRPAVVEAPSGDGVVVEAPAMRALYEMIDRVALGTIHVLLLGETGVGKEVVAARVHARSPRADGPYVKLNCAGFTDTLVESELFGHEKGAFTGAVNAHPGLLESAQGGTIFLDEVGELSLAVQARLLRVLEDRIVRRVGSLKERPVDVRFVAATNRDLEAEVRAGRFREDLYFRLNGVTLVIPPLRDRAPEFAPLMRGFVERARRELGRARAPEVSPEALALLARYRWPGNLRELRNVMERAVLLADDVITPQHLPTERMGAALPAAPPAAAPPDAQPDAGGDDAERAMILAVLERCAGNQSLAAKQLGMTRRMLITRLDRYALKRPRKNQSE